MMAVLEGGPVAGMRFSLESDRIRIPIVRKDYLARFIERNMTTAEALEFLDGPGVFCAVYEKTDKSAFFGTANGVERRAVYAFQEIEQ